MTAQQQRSNASSPGSPVGGNCPLRALGLGCSRSFRCFVGGPVECLNDLVITRAAAEVASDALFDLRLSRVWDFLDQLGSGHQKARRAVATLNSPTFDKSLLDRVQRSIMRQPFDSNNFRAISAWGWHH